MKRREETNKKGERKQCFKLPWSTYWYGNMSIWWWMLRFPYMWEWSACWFLLFVLAFLHIFTLSRNNDVLWPQWREPTPLFVGIRALIDLLFPEEPYLSYQYNTVTYLVYGQACCCLILATPKPNFLHLFLFLSCL